MYSLCCAALSALSLLVLCPAAMADSGGDEPETMAFLRWTGSMHQNTLSDGSILSEYVAQTESDDIRSATLQVAFVPRFGCTPLISFRFSSADLIAKASPSDFLLSIDAQTMPFPILIDEEGDDQVRLSLNADSVGQKRIRQILDNSTEATLAWPSTDEELPVGTHSPHSSRQANTGAVNFSLLGSRRTVQAMEAQCQAHAPIPYEN